LWVHEIVGDNVPYGLLENEFQILAGKADGKIIILEHGINKPVT
jgi:hypothetical protein